MSSDQEEVRQFFLSRILNEAAAEGRPLTELQRNWLLSGSATDKKQLQQLEQEFDRENPEYLEFMEWVTTLLKRAVEKELLGDPAAKSRFDEALLALEKSEGGSPLWFAVVPALPSGQAAISRGFRLGWIIFILIALVVYGWLKVTGQI